MNMQLKIFDKDIKKLSSNVTRFNMTSKLKKLEDYKRYIANTSGVSDEEKAEYIDKCDDAINRINSISHERLATQTVAEQEIDGDTIDSSEERVGESKKHFKAKKALVTTGLIALIGLTAPGILNKCSGPEKEPTKIEKTNGSNDNTEIDKDNSKEIKDTLNFDTENSEVMINNIGDFMTDSMPKGLELDKDNLSNDVESFVDFYVALNINEIGPGYLAELYQNDNKNYLDVFNNFTYWAMNITDEAMMSTEGNVYNISTLVSNKEEAVVLQKALDLLAIQHDKGLAGDKKALKANTAEFKTLLEDTLFNENSATYSSSFKVMLAYSAMNMDTLLQNYPNINLVDNDTRKMLYEDPEIACAMMVREANESGKKYNNDDLMLLINSSEKNQAALGLGLQLEKKFDQMVMIYNNPGNDYSEKISIDEVINTLVSRIDLTLYKANQEYRDYNDITHEISFPTVKVPEDSVVINDGKNFVTKDELDKHGVTTDNKTSEQIKNEYEDKVEQKVEEELKDDKEFKDNKGNTLKEGEDAPDYAAEYSKGYTAGSEQGAKDGNALATKKSNTNGSEGYKAGYKAGYDEAYEEAKATRLAADKKKKEEIEKLKTEKPVKEDVVDEGIIEQPKPTPKPTPTPTPKPTPTPTPEQPVIEEIVEEVIEEEVIEEGILEQESSTASSTYDENGIYQASVTSMSYDELYNLYYDYLYGSTLEEEAVKTK